MLAAALAACGSAQPVYDVAVAPAVISPNADGKDDVARIGYRVGQPTRISIFLTDASGRRFDLRTNEPRSPSPMAYEFLFSGVSQGRMLPDGAYTWHVAGDGVEFGSGSLRIENGDKAYPKIEDFTIDTAIITPNRDGINDRMAVNAYLTKRARLSVYVLGPDGVRYEVPRREGAKLLPSSTEDELEPGRYAYDFDGGIDLGAEPPPDGTYTLVAEAQDRVGQRDVLTRAITIKDSGRPAAEIVIQPNGSGVEWSGVRFEPKATLPLSGTLRFTMTVRNTGLVPIRTAGPFSGAECYTMDQNRYTRGFIEEPGVWRVGVDWETNTGTDHPWRWGVGAIEDLTQVKSPNGDTLYYLAPGKQVLVRGCVTFNKLQPRNPFVVWASLIQEQVEIAPINNRVTPIQVELVRP